MDDVFSIFDLLKKIMQWVPFFRTGCPFIINLFTISMTQFTQTFLFYHDSKKRLLWYFSLRLNNNNNNNKYS